MESNNNNELKKPSQILSDIIKLEETIPHILDDYIKNYISYNKNPQSDENAHLFENIKNNLENENAKLFVLNNSIEKGIEELNTKLFTLNKKIQIEKTENEKMKKQFGRIENKYNGSDEMITNYREIYRDQYLKNIAMITGILLGSVVLTKVFYK
jgi:hypothetical protein